MATPPVLDFDSLLAPISDDAPTGVDARNVVADSKTNQSALTKINNLRTTAAQSEDLSREENRTKSLSTIAPQWEEIVRAGADTIQNQSKDLRILGYLLEALARTKGFAGLRDGFRLTRELIDRYWGAMHPLPEEGDDSADILQVIEGYFDLNGPLEKSLNRIHVTNGASEPLALGHYIQAMKLEDETDPSKRQQRIAAGWIPLSAFNAAGGDTPKEFYNNLLDDLEQCKPEFEQLDAVFVDKCGQAAPPTSTLKEALAEAERRITAFAQHLIPERFAVAEEAAAEEGQAGSNGSEQGGAKSAARTREGALKTLLEIAVFFEQTEPHSPIPFALRQVERWGKTSLPELLTELISDQNVRAALFKQVGITKPNKDDE